MCIAQGVSPERGSGLTPLVGDCVGLLASLVGLYIIFSVSRGRARTTCTLDHLPMLFRPTRGLGSTKYEVSKAAATA